MLGVCSFLLLLTSCFTTRSYVGNIKPNEPLTKINKITNNFFLWGLAPGGKAEFNAKDYVDGNEDYVIEKQETFLNGFLSTITSGIYSPRTTSFYIRAK